MNKKLMFWIMTLAFAAAPALVSAQRGPDFDDEEDVEMMDDGPGMPPGGPGMEEGMGRQGGGPGMDQRGQMGRQKQMIIKKKMMRGGQGGPGFMPEEKVLEVIKKHDPAFAKKVAEMREIAPAKYKMVIQMSGRMFGAARMQKDESIEADTVRALALEFESKELSLKYNKATDSEKGKIKGELSKVLSELFDLKSKGQALRVKMMEEDLGRLKKKLDSRKANKVKIVQQRLDQLTGEGYGW